MAAAGAIGVENASAATLVAAAGAIGVENASAATLGGRGRRHRHVENQAGRWKRGRIVLGTVFFEIVPASKTLVTVAEVVVVMVVVQGGWWWWCFKVVVVVVVVQGGLPVVVVVQGGWPRPAASRRCGLAGLGPAAARGLSVRAAE